MYFVHGNENAYNKHDRGKELAKLGKDLLEVSLTPKEYLTKSRINAIVRQLAKNATIFQIIEDFEYTDQSHLIKEFKQLRNNTTIELKRKKLFLQDQLGIPDFIRF